MEFFDNNCFKIEYFNYQLYLQDLSKNNNLIWKSNSNLPIGLEKNQILIFGNLMENMVRIKKINNHILTKESGENILNLNFENLNKKFKNIYINKNVNDLDFIQFYEFYIKDYSETCDLPFLELEFIKGVNKGKIMNINLGIKYFEELYLNKSKAKVIFEIGKNINSDININSSDIDSTCGFIEFNKEVKKWVLKSKNNSSFIGIMLSNHKQLNLNKPSNIHKIVDKMEFNLLNTDLSFKIKQKLIE